MRLTPFELGWLVGLIEADGCFTFDGKTLSVQVKMIDLDTVQRFATLVSVTVYGPYYYEGQQLGTTPTYQARITGDRARQFMASTMQHFSVRRREQIKKLIGDQIPIANL